MEIVDIQAAVVQVYLAWLRQRVWYLSCCWETCQTRSSWVR